MEGLFFLAGLGAIVWLAYWTTLEGQETPKDKQRWSPFEWREDQASLPTKSPTKSHWRQRTRR